MNNLNDVGEVRRRVTELATQAEAIVKAVERTAADGRVGHGGV